MDKKLMMELIDIRPNPMNPRTIKDEKFLKLVESIILFPGMMLLRPTIVDETLTALGGNMRYKACVHISQMGRDDVMRLLTEKGKPENITALEPLFSGIFPEGWVKQEKNLTPEQKLEFIVKDNVGFGEWNWDELEDWDQEDLSDWGMDIQEDFSVESTGGGSGEGSGGDGEEGEGTTNNQYEVIVMCENAGTQEAVYKDLTGMGYECKIAVV